MKNDTLKRILNQAARHAFYPAIALLFAAGAFLWCTLMVFVGPRAVNPLLGGQLPDGFCGSLLAGCALGAIAVLLLVLHKTSSVEQPAADQ